MTTINAQTIIDAVMQAHATAPGANDKATPSKIKFQTSARGFHTICNTRENLARFADTVRKNARLFGGGLAKAAPKTRTAAAWPAQLVRLVFELLQDKQHQDAAELAQAQCGAVFYEGVNHKTKDAQAFLLWAPQPVEGLSEEFKSARCEDGRYCVYQVSSGASLNGQHRTRKGAEEAALKTWGQATEEKRAQALASFKPCDQAAARLLWLTQHGIITQEVIDARIADEALAREEEKTLGQRFDEERAKRKAAREAQAAHDVAQLVAQAAAGAAIEKAQADQATTETPDARELATVDACEASQSATTCNASAQPGSTAIQTTTSTPHASSYSAGQSINSKSGQWSARFYTATNGAQVLAFQEASGAHGEWEFSTARERMAALQTMARNTDQAQAATSTAPATPAHTPAALEKQATTNTPAPSTTGADYTAPRKTSNDNTAPQHDTPQDLSAAKPGALSITITRAEGLMDECDQPATVASFADADALLMQWSDTAPKNGGYNKCDFSITWPNGTTYSGRYDLQHHSTERPSLTAHMVDVAEYNTGKFCPAHMSEQAYSAQMERIDEDTRAAYAETLATLAALGVYFAKARPVAVDLRALLAAGATPAQLVGMGVIYTGNRATDGGQGAITQAEPCRYHEGLKIWVTLEDGRTLTASPSNFGCGSFGSYRFNMKRHGAPYLAQLAAAVATAQAQHTAAQDLKNQAKKQALIDTAAQYSHLKQYTPGDKLSGATLAAANMRTLLKQRFPGVKFGVKSSSFSGGNSVSVRWTDGPTGAQVDEVVNMFSQGYFDGMTDCYEYQSSAFTELFGSTKFANTSRTLSDAALTAIIAQVWPTEAERPTLADHREGNRNTYDDNGRSRVYMAGVNWTNYKAN